MMSPTTSAAEHALVTALQWLKRRTNKQMQVAIEYMYGHAVILRWTTALLALVDLLDQQVTLGFCIFHVPAVLIATSEVISATLSLPHQIFCPLILWAARRLHEDVQRSNGVIEKLPAMLLRNICLDALGIQS